MLQSDVQLRTGRARSRPVRVAFLVPLDCSHRTLDAIFANSYSRWGGRFSPLIPCSGGKVQEPYWPWLKANDPDIIYSFEALADEEQLRIHRELYPSEITLHPHQKDNEAHPIRVSMRTKLLSSLSTLLAPNPERHLLNRGAPPRLFDVHWRRDDAQSLTDTFGSFDRSGTHRYPFPAEWKHLATSITLTTAAIQNDPRHGFEGELITDIAEAWTVLAKRETLSMAECSSQHTIRMEVYDKRWGTSFNLIVGDDVEDRMLFWNIRQMMPAWTDAYIAAARISTADFENPSTLAGIAEFLRWRNHINAGSGGQSSVTLRSVSLREERLEQLKEMLLATTKVYPVWAQKCGSLAELLPDAEAISRANFDGTVFSSRPQWKEFTWVGDLAHPAVDEPQHIMRSNGPQAIIDGCWAADVELEATENLSEYDNVNHIWLFSKRLRMASAFKCSFHNVTHIHTAMANRVNRQGMLSSFPARGFELASIEVPTSDAAFRTALIMDGAGPRVAHSPVYPSPPLSYFRASDKGRYLRGLLGLCGSLTDTANFLLHSFWSTQLEIWGATTAAKQGDLSRIEARLKNQLRNGFSSTDKDFTKIAKIVASEARNIQFPRNTITFSTLEANWKAYRAEYWKNQARPSATEEEEKEWDQRERETLVRSVQALALSEVLFQGFVHACPHCHHKNWISIAALSKQVDCLICGINAPAPVTIDWEFRLNEFVRDALKQHGLQSVVWCLAHLRQKGRDSFYFESQSDVWLPGTDFRAPRDAEFDLLAVADGVSYLCEIKSHKELLAAEEQRKLLRLAEHIRPNMVLVAVMDAFTNKVALQKSLQPTLDAFGIKLELRGVNDWPKAESPYLR